MERRFPSEHLPSPHPGYYESASFEVIRQSLQPGDQLLFRTRSGSVYSFILKHITNKELHLPFGASAELIDAPHRALAFEGGNMVWSGDPCFILFDPSFGSLQILFEPTPPKTSLSIPSTPTITTSRVVGFGVRKQN